MYSFLDPVWRGGGGGEAVRGGGAGRAEDPQHGGELRPGHPLLELRHTHDHTQVRGGQ